MFKYALLFLSVFALGNPQLTSPAATAGGPVLVLRTPGGGIQPQLATDASGGIHVLYFQGDPAHGDVYYTRLVNGAFAPPMRVNTNPGSALATGSVRGAQFAIGRNGRVHVAWLGSSAAIPKASGDTTPVLYARLNDAKTAFEKERNLVQSAVGLDGTTIAADPLGHVYVAWHAGLTAAVTESNRRVFLVQSDDDGKTFGAQRAISDATVGACGCCGLQAFADRRGTLSLLFRAARENTHRDTYLLSSRDHGRSFSSDKLEDWSINACPMSTFALSDTGNATLAAWETAGQVQWTRISASGERGPIVRAPGSTNGRKHPAVAGNAKGDTLLAWTDGTAWNRGGALGWQVFDQAGQPTAEHGMQPGVPVWGLVAAATMPDGRFLLVY